MQALHNFCFRHNETAFCLYIFILTHFSEKYNNMIQKSNDSAIFSCYNEEKYKKENFK